MACLSYQVDCNTFTYLYVHIYTYISYTFGTYTYVNADYYLMNMAVIKFFVRIYEYFSSVILWDIGIRVLWLLKCIINIVYQYCWKILLFNIQTTKSLIRKVTQHIFSFSKYQLGITGLSFVLVFINVVNHHYNQIPLLCISILLD